MLPTETERVDLDADLEQEQHHAHVGKHLQLVSIGDITRRERRDDQPGREISEHCRQAESARDPAGSDREQ